MGRKQDVWHEELERITTSLDRLALDADEEVRSVVIDRLKRPTDIFLRKRNWFFCSSSHEDRLNALIRGHTDKSVALLSCAHALSRSTIRSLLATPIELNVDLANDSSVSRYTGLIAAVHLVNSNAVTQNEAKRARALIRLLEKKSTTFLRELRNFFSVDGPGLLYDLFPPGSLEALLKRLCLSFVAQVETMREQCDWAAAHRALCELKGAIGLFPALDTLIHTSIQFVGAWARWRPSKHRIFSQENLSIQHKAALLDVLVLNGPDFTYARHRSFAEALLYRARCRGMNYIRHGQFVVWLSTDTRVDSRTLVDGVLNFPAGSHISMPGAVEVFVFLCLRNAVNLNTLRILEEAAALRNSKVYESLSEIFYSVSSAIRTSAVIRLLGIVHTNGNHTLIDGLNGYIRDIIQEDFRDMQMKLYDLMEAGTQRNPQSTAVHVQALGHSITSIPSLQSTVDQHTQALLDDWPSATEIEALFQLRAEVETGRVGSGIETLMDQYCLVRLTGRGILEDVARRAVIALLWHWQERPHAPRRTLALSIISCSSLTLDVKAECLRSIRDMDDEPVRELNTIICSSTEMACAHLASLICAKRFARHREQGCWKDVLAALMEKHKDTLLPFTLRHMEVKTWFAWLAHLRKIFDVHAGSNGRGHPILQYQPHAWAHVLEAEYLTVLSRLEDDSSMAGSLVLVQACLRGWTYQDPVRRVLDFFRNKPGHDLEHSLLEAVEGLIVDGGEFDAQVWDVLAGLATVDEQIDI